MSWSIGLHLRDHLADLVGYNEADRSQLKRQYFYPQMNVESMLGSILQELNLRDIGNLRLYTDLPYRLAIKNYGGEAAVLITSGFENWLEMTAPIKTPYFTSVPRRHSMPIERDLFFGVTERVNASGQVEKAVDLTEMEFLAAKLQMNQIKNVAICFLHSMLNSENEQRAKEFLESKGFRVHLSSQVVPHETLEAESVDEKARFWSAILNAYVFEQFASQLKKIQAIFEPRLSSNGVISIGKFPLDDVLNGRVSLLQAGNQYYDRLADKFARSSPLFHACVDGFALLHGGKRRQSTWLSMFGPVAISAPAFFLPRIHPLTLLSKNFMTPIGFSSEIASYDPGPMVFGRGLTPTFFDLIALKIDPQDEAVAARVSDPRNGRGLQKFKEQLSVYKRIFSQAQSLSDEELGDQLFNLGCEILRDEIRVNLADSNAVNELLICGPLAATLAKPLRARLIDDLSESPCFD